MRLPPLDVAIMAMALLFASVPAQARLGESSAECEKRYGKPVFSRELDGGYSLRYYSKNGFLVGVTTKDGVSVAVSYSKPNSGLDFLNDSERKGEWTAIVALQKYLDIRLNAEEIAYFLDANSEGKKWDVVLEGRLWRRPDGAEASYDYGTHSLLIGRKTYIEYISNRNQGDLSGL